ncbi:MAG: prepilin-type N-terminal cleavage/methylation domain-containing protein [Syntrophales bacterium]|jgi:type IV pilus assembly protein PilW|nr:prepilin-type N-terminal cleavage/methylation domain-containing protein [Syntrophales bacterium]
MNTDNGAAKGFTLVETIIAMAVGMIVLATLYSLFSAQNQAFSVQEQIVDMQQNARSGMDLMLRDLRMAGYNPEKINSWISGTKPGLTGASSDSVSYAADLNANGDTTATSSNPAENITYDMYNEGGISYLARTANGFRRAVVRNLESLALAYYDQAGNELSATPSLAAVRKIRVTITTKTDLPDPYYSDSTHGDHYRRYSLAFEVTPRNLGL